MKVTTEGLELGSFSNELEITTEQHLAAVAVQELPNTGPLSVENFQDTLSTQTVAAEILDEANVVLQYNFTAGLVFSNASSVPSNSTVAQDLLFEFIKTAFLTEEHYNNFVTRLSNNPELQRIEGVKISVNPYFDPVSTLPETIADGPTQAPTVNQNNNNDDEDEVDEQSGITTIAATFAAVVGAIILIVGCWYLRRKRETEARIQQAAKLAKQRSIRKQNSLRAAQSRKLRNESMYSSNSSSPRLGSERSMSSSNDGDGAGGNNQNQVGVPRQRNNPATGATRSSMTKPALASRRASSLMAITETEDEYSESSSDISDDLRTSLTSQRHYEQGSALGVRDVSQSSMDTEDLYTFATSGTPNIIQPVMVDVDDMSVEHADDDYDDDERFSNVSNTDEEFEDEFRKSPRT